MTREQELRAVIADERERCAEKDGQIESLRKALTEIAEWTDRYTSQGHPVSTVAKRALTGQ